MCIDWCGVQVRSYAAYFTRDTLISSHTHTPVHHLHHHHFYHPSLLLSATPASKLTSSIHPFRHSSPTVLPFNTRTPKPIGIPRTPGMGHFWPICNDPYNIRLREQKIIANRDVEGSNFWKPAGTGCGRISIVVSGRNRNRIVWWLLRCSACRWCASSWLTYVWTAVC